MPQQRPTKSIHELNVRPILNELNETRSRHQRVFGKRNIFARRWNLSIRYVNYFTKLEKTYMPRQAYNSGKGNPMPTFASVRLTEKDRDALSEWSDKNAKDFLEYQTRLLVAGWKLSIKADLENSCFIVSHTCGAEKDSNYNVCLTSRSDDWEEALWMNIYKLFVMFDGKKLPTENPKNNWG